MRYYHRTSFFPLVIVLLTLALGGFIFWSTRSEPGPATSPRAQEVETVDPDAYRSEVSQILSTFEERLAASQDDQDTRRAAQTALSGLLALRVPSAFKDLHLALAVALSQIDTTLQSGQGAIDEPLADIQELKRAYPWLGP